MRRARVGRPGLLGTAARTAVIAGTATAVSNKVSMHQADKRAAQSTEEQQASVPQNQAPPQPTAPAQAAGGGESTADQIARLANLHAQGLLTADEFAAAKAKILGM